MLEVRTALEGGGRAKQVVVRRAGIMARHVSNQLVLARLEQLAQAVLLAQV